MASTGPWFVTLDAQVGHCSWGHTSIRRVARSTNLTNSLLVVRFFVSFNCIEFLLIRNKFLQVFLYSQLFILTMAYQPDNTTFEDRFETWTGTEDSAVACFKTRISTGTLFVLPKMDICWVVGNTRDQCLYKWLCWQELCWSRNKTQTFITLLTRACHKFLFWAGWIQSIQYSLTSSLIFSSHVHLHRMKLLIM